MRLGTQNYALFGNKTSMSVFITQNGKPITTEEDRDLNINMIFFFFFPTLNALQTNWDTTYNACLWSFAASFTKMSFLLSYSRCYEGFLVKFGLG